jgi:SPP1 gp7 family putative phage head morphogenesis protein
MELNVSLSVKRSLLKAERELVRMISNIKEPSSFKLSRIRVAALDLKRVRAALKEIDATVERELLLQMPAIAKTATIATAESAMALNKLFGRFSDPINLNTAEIISRNLRTSRRRIKDASDGISSTLEKAINSELAVGHLQGKTFSEMTLALRKKMGGRIVQAHNSAQRIVRTESMHAYNSYHRESVKELNATDAGWVSRWDASPDKRRCPMCAAFDGKIADVAEEKPFRASWKTEGANEKRRSGSTLQAPAHPNCRCVLTPWRREWGDEKSTW